MIRKNNWLVQKLKIFKLSLQNYWVFVRKSAWQHIFDNSWIGTEHKIKQVFLVFYTFWRLWKQKQIVVVFWPKVLIRPKTIRGGLIILARARGAHENSPLSDFTTSWAWFLPPPLGIIFQFFSFYIVRMAKYPGRGGGTSPPLRSSARGTSPSPSRFYAHVSLYSLIKIFSN